MPCQRPYWRVSSTPHQPPKDTLHLFSGPPNPEPLLGRLDTPLDVLNSIETTTKRGWITSHDYRLQNRVERLVTDKVVQRCRCYQHVYDREERRERRSGWE
jgi:hypothetical protein